MKNFEKDLTSGSVVKQLILFSLPFIFSNIIQSLYNIADMLIVGRYIGKVGISGVNIGGQVTFLMTTVAISLCAGGTIIVAQYIGAKNRRNAQESIATLFTFLVFLSVCITVIMLIFDDIILDILDTPSEARQYAKDYLNITTLGLFFIYGYNALSGVMRGMGDSKTPLYLVAGACIINVILDLIFVGKMGMAVKGAAIATIISQAFSMFSCIIFLVKRNFMFDFKPSSFKIKFDKLRLILSTGFPIIVQNVFTTVSFLAMTTLSNGLGVTASAALGVVSRYNGFAILPSIAVGSSVSAMVAQNIGAGQLERAKHTMFSGIFISYVISIPIFLVTKFLGEHFVALFDKDPELISAGVKYLQYFSFDYISVPFLFSVMGLITGTGHTLFSSFVGVSSSILVRVPVAIYLVKFANLGLQGIGMSAPIATSISCIAATIYYISGHWKKPVIVKRPAVSDGSI